MADIDTLAAALFGSKRAETQEVLTDATTRTYVGTALTDSKDGTVFVDLGGDVTLPDDVEGLTEHSAEGIEVSTGPGVRAGDEVIVTLVGGTPLKTPMVTGVAGEGDDQDARIATASAAAEEAWQWADEAHDAATDAQASASAAQESASSAASAASSAVSSAAHAEQSAQQAIGDAARAESAAQQAIEDAADAAQAAGEAKTSAQQAVEEANEAHDAATAAQAEASRASQSATEAKGAATRANTAANDALAQVATVEDVIGVVDWVTEHGTYSKTTDTAIDAGKVYYTRSGSGTQADPYLYAAVPEPVAEDLGTYYELSVQEALSQYVASHLALTDAGLYVLKDGSGYRLLLTNDGMQVIDPAGHTVATYGESITFDSERPQRIGGTDSYVEWRDTNGDGTPDSLVIVADSIELGSGQSVSTGSGNVWANHTSATSASGITSWSDSFVAPTTAKPYVWMKSYYVIDGQRVYGNPACITGAKGADGQQGPQGPQGETGVGVKSYAQMWAKSTSKTTAPTSGWSESRPTSIGTNEYLWVRVDTTWTDNTTTQGTPVVDQNTTDLWHTSAALRVDVDSIDSDVDGLKTTVSGHTTTIQQHTTSIGQNTEDIALRATKTEVQQVRPAYATSTTGAGTAAKVATIDPAVTGYALYKGASVAVTFSTANTAATPTLNLNSTGAKQIRSYTGAALSEAEYKWAAGATVDLVYDGTYWRMQDSGAVKRVTAAEASIKVNADNIESKVSKDGVISSINQSAETVKIKAEKVEIDGTAVFSAISSDVDDAITSKGYQTSSQVNSAITSKGYATTTQAQGYASTAKSEAISAAATDATTKANAAQTAATNAANTATDNKLKSYSTTAQANNLYDAKGAAATAENNAKAYTDALEIGGRNLLYDTSGWSKWAKTAKAAEADDVLTCVNTDTSSGFQRANGWFIPDKADVMDREIVISFDAKKTDSTALSSLVFQMFTTSAAPRSVASGNINEGTRYYINLSATSTAKVTILNASEINATTWTRVSVGFVPSQVFNTSYTEQAYLAVYVGINNTVASAQFRHIKAEYGEKATDWTPAIEDIEANTVKRTQRIWYRTNASSAPSTPGTTSSNWVTKADDGNDAWTKMHIAISSTHKYIYTCEQYEMANGTVGYTSVLLDNTITVIDGGNIITGSVTANKLNAADINASKTLTVGAMTDAAASTILNSNVVVGGRNLLPKTGSADGYYANTVPSGNHLTTVNDDGECYEQSVTSTSAGIPMSSNVALIELESGSEYTLSMMVKSTVARTFGLQLRKNNNGADGGGYVYQPDVNVAANIWTRLTYSFTGPSDADVYARLYVAAGTACTVRMRELQLERGNKATDWTPAPEDMATAESLAGTNESLEGAITDIGELSDQLSGTVTEQNKTITDIQTYLNSLRKDLDAEIQSRQQWLNFNSAEGLVIGAAGSSFKTVTTNTSQQFKNGGTVLAETSGTEFVAPVMRSDQLLIGNWMWTRRDNGNLSLKWIG